MAESTDRSHWSTKSHPLLVFVPSAERRPQTFESIYCARCTRSGRRSEYSSERNEFRLFCECLCNVVVYCSTNGKQITCTWSQSTNSINGLSQRSSLPAKFDSLSCMTIETTRVRIFTSSIAFSTLISIVIPLFRHQIVLRRCVRVLLETFAESILCEKYAHSIRPFWTENSTLRKEASGGVNRDRYTRIHLKCFMWIYSWW